MPALDRACLRSFAHAGHPVTVYGYAPIADLPAGVAFGDAREIAPEASVRRFRWRGEANLSHFSDYFRYRLFAATDATWIDTDILLLRDLPPRGAGNLFALETPTSICGAIMSIARADPHLPTLIARTEALMDTDLVWGATGPRLLTRTLGGDVVRTARPTGAFFPIHYDLFWKAFLPEAAEECAHLAAGAATHHLWNNLVVSMGVWKELAPPEGSFLWHALAHAGTLELFRDVYPADVMRRMVANWRFRKTGADIGALALARQALPSLGRTLGPRLRGLLQSRR